MTQDGKVEHKEQIGSITWITRKYPPCNTMELRTRARLIKLKSLNSQ